MGLSMFSIRASLIFPFTLWNVRYPDLSYIQLVPDTTFTSNSQQPLHLLHQVQQRLAVWFNGGIVDNLKVSFNFSYMKETFNETFDGKFIRNWNRLSAVKLSAIYRIPPWLRNLCKRIFSKFSISNCNTVLTPFAITAYVSPTHLLDNTIINFSSQNISVNDRFDILFSSFYET